VSALSHDVPSRPCTGCWGRGCYAQRGRGGPRRPYDPRTFDQGAGDVYEASCADCRGLGRVFISAEEAAADARREADGARASYRGYRWEICNEYGIGREEFDSFAARRLGRDRSPRAWVAAARAVAAFFWGLEKK